MPRSSGCERGNYRRRDCQHRGRTRSRTPSLPSSRAARRLRRLLRRRVLPTYDQVVARVVCNVASLRRSDRQDELHLAWLSIRLRRKGVLLGFRPTALRLKRNRSGVREDDRDEAEHSRCLDSREQFLCDNSLRQQGECPSPCASFRRIAPARLARIGGCPEFGEVEYGRRVLHGHTRQH